MGRPTVASHGPKGDKERLQGAMTIAAWRVRERRQRLERMKMPTAIDVWAEQRYMIPATGTTIKLLPHQKAILRLMFTKNDDGHFPYQTCVFSTIKKSGKTAISGVVGRWWAETQSTHQEILCIGNDAEQAKERAFKAIHDSLTLDPNYDVRHDRIPGEWDCLKTSFTNQRTLSRIKAIAVDSKGEAGAEPALTIWTEIWGIYLAEAIKFWEEMTPIPTLPNSIRYVETYAGYEQESTLLLDLHDTGKSGRQLTSRDVYELTGVEPGAFAEAPGLDDLVPIWVNPDANMIMYWDDGLEARRMPWQKGERADDYYRAQELILGERAYRRLHRNEWVSSEGAFVQREQWESCKADLPPLLPGDTTPLVLGVDAASSADCFAIVAVSRHPGENRHDDIAVRKVRVWNPSETGRMDYDEAERFLRVICRGGHMADNNVLHPSTMPEEGCARCDAKDFDIPSYNVTQICYDPYQLEHMMGRLRKDAVAWCEPFIQAGDRKKADRQLYDLIVHKRIEHDGNKQLETHVLNASAKLQKDEDSTLLLVKSATGKKIDACVALSMAAFRCLYLRL